MALWSDAPQLHASVSGSVVELSWTSEIVASKYNVVEIYNDQENVVATTDSACVCSISDVSLGRHVYAVYPADENGGVGNRSNLCSIGVGGKSPNIGLNITGSDDIGLLFRDWRVSINSEDNTSNMMVIDSRIGEIITALQKLVNNSVPVPSQEDAGKYLQVDNNGEYVLEEFPKDEDCFVFDCGSSEEVIS